MLGSLSTWTIFLNQINFFVPSNFCWRRKGAYVTEKQNTSQLLVYSTQSLKVISNLVSPLLSHVINKSYTCGKFPDCFKIARVTSTFKSREKDKPDNYRPTSILLVLSKIYERVVINQLYNYLDHFELLKQSHFGDVNFKHPSIYKW